ncbi:hypothetical protein A1O3_04564 [Capronia epimyces CBS 606.96]|uniref:Uncharacterized protein n=1 Tax=Capronia epimyces CBS 606.96 TaxID=1182542 RepID=W9Y506_9EURO|nr:uncharacterized protein A1O3_04564 [Capronia epimyces CBS 606.96]EXJ87603.1 hypothetical protein A1O3_04564 [Capronia epimyces CBS 606.96]
MSHSHESQGSCLPARLVEKGLPELPKVTIESPQQPGRTDTEPCPSPTVRKYDGLRTSPRNARHRIPQFQQSKRWAKMHSSNQSVPPLPPPKAPVPPGDQREEDNDDRILTMREVSFEQQRAQLKKPVVRRSNVDRPRRSRLVSRSSSTLQDEGLCRSSPTQYWKTVKATVAKTPHRSSRKCFGKRPLNRRVAPAKHRDTKSGRTADRVPVPAKVRGGNKGLQAHVATARQTPALPDTVAVVEPSTHSAGHPEERDDSKILQSTSPIPSLHDPEKDSRFSEECMAILNSVDFNRDWLLPAASVLPAVGKMHEDERFSVQQHTEVPEYHNQEISIQDALACAPSRTVGGPRSIPAITLTTTASNNTTPRRPQPPARGSSKALASLVDMQTSKSPDFPKVSETNSDPSTSAQGQLYTDTPGTQFSSQSRWLLRMPSVASTTGQPALSPRSAMSTDTMTRIEAQVRGISYVVSHPEPKTITLSSSETRSDGPTSIPPERPLPALPAEAKWETETTQHSASTESRRGSKEKSNMQAQPPQLESAIQLLRSSWQSSPPVSPMPQAKQRTDGRHSADLVSLSSLRREASRSSLSSSRSFNRHTISGPRADRVREKRMRDLASSRSHSPKSDCAGSIEAANHRTILPAVTDDDVPGSPEQLADQLDQFPAVPSSRPPSLPNIFSHAPHIRRQSSTSQTSPVRQSSKSKHRRNSRPVQHLSQSNIFVVVDSDPVTARFRAGAMSPSPSIGGGHGRSGSQYQKHTRTGSNLKEVTTSNQSPVRSLKQKTSLRSLKGGDDSTSVQSSPGKARETKRATRTGNGRPSSSSDESQQRGPRSPKKTSSRPQKRRRWNSNDIGLIKVLHEDLEEYYGTILKQEEKIKWQANQIHMIVRVLEPINRARGVKTFSYSGTDESASCTTTDEETPTSHTVIEKNSAGTNLPTRNTPSSGLPVQRTEGDNPIEHGHYRSNSTGNASMASTTGSISTDMSNALRDDASMTDPHEYDPPSSATLKPAPLSSSKKTNAQTPVSRGHSDANTASIPVLRQPPPVAKIIPRGKLREEHLELLSPGSQHGPKANAATEVYQSLGLNHSDIGDDNDDDKDQQQNQQQLAHEVARLSVNHVLTSTEEMDRAIEQLTMYG